MNIRCLFSVCLLPLLALAGCATSANFPDIASDTAGALHGNIHGGQQPVYKSHVHLMAASAVHYGQNAASLLNSTVTTSDSIGNYVPTDVNGNFSITASEYNCTQGQIVYVLATQGNPGLSGNVNNTALSMMAVLGACPATGNFIAADPLIQINEVTTVAGAYALAGFMSSQTQLSTSGTTLASTGITNAAANAGYLASITTGYANSTMPGGSGSIPTAEINTLANILASCINSDGTTPCTKLLGLALDSGGLQPSNTVDAILNIAHNPGQNVSQLFDLAGATAVPYPTALSGPPSNWGLQIVYPNTNVSGDEGTPMAVDKSGNLYFATEFNSVREITPSGALSTNESVAGMTLAISPSSGDIVGIQSGYLSDSTRNFSTSDSGTNWAGDEDALAFDKSGNLWVGNFRPASIGEIYSNGSANNITGVTTGGLTAGSANNVSSVAVDALGNVWATCYYCNTVAEFNSSLENISPSTGYTGAGYEPFAVAIDSANHAWVLSFAATPVTEFDSSGNVVGSFGSTLSSGLEGLAIDGAGNVWLANYEKGLCELNNSGAVLSTGYAATGNPGSIAIDGSGNVWLGDHLGNYIDEFIGIATPVVTPLTPGKLGTQP